MGAPSDNTGLVRVLPDRFPRKPKETGLSSAVGSGR
jgi:hypothetical protein